MTEYVILRQRRKIGEGLCLNKWTCKSSVLLFKIRLSVPLHLNIHRKEAKVVDLTYECLEQMDNLILQSAKGIHILFQKQDIIAALKSDTRDEHDLKKLKKVQEVLYKFISLKDYDEKRDFLKTLKNDEYSLLIRAYFKIVDNSMLNKTKTRH